MGNIGIDGEINIDHRRCLPLDEKPVQLITDQIRTLVPDQGKPRPGPAELVQIETGDRQRLFEIGSLRDQFPVRVVDRCPAPKKQTVLEADPVAVHDKGGEHAGIGHADPFDPACRFELFVIAQSASR